VSLRDSALRFLACLMAVPASACSVSPAQTDAVLTDLLFVSTRSPTDSRNPARRLGDERGPTSYGRCSVRHDPLSQQGLWDGVVDFFAPGNSREIVSVEMLEQASFWDLLRTDVAEPAPIVLFVHGYAYGFARGCRRVSDLQHVLGERARVLLFSWPSDGNPLAYEGDREDLDRSVPELAKVIRQASEVAGPDRFSIVAHSMGARGVLGALEILYAGNAALPVASNLVFIASDYGSEPFEADIGLLRQQASRITLYVSDKDLLLKLSAFVNRESRLGQAGDEITVLSGLETIDVSGVPRYHPAGHEYHYFNPVVEQDLVELLTEDRSAANRRATASRELDGLRYWILRESE